MKFLCWRSAFIHLVVFGQCVGYEVTALFLVLQNDFKCFLQIWRLLKLNFSSENINSLLLIFTSDVKSGVIY